MGVTSQHEDMKVSQLRQLLKDKGLPVSSRKSKLIKQLERLPTKKTEKAWQHSKDKKRLKQALLNDTLPIHNMSIKEVCNSEGTGKGRKEAGQGG